MTRTLAFLLLALALVGHVRAHGGEDHGDGGPAPTVAVAPRAEAHSEEFELVAVLGGERLTVWLDHYATNAPVAAAQLELESGAWKAAGRPAGEGVFEFDAAALAGAGEHPLVFTVQTPDSADLLQAVLRIAAPPPPPATARSLTPWLGGAAGVLVAGAGVWWWQRRRHGQGARA